MKVLKHIQNALACGDYDTFTTLMDSLRSQALAGHRSCQEAYISQVRTYHQNLDQIFQDQSDERIFLKLTISKYHFNQHRSTINLCL